jgi:hypothetical protein
MVGFVALISSFLAAVSLGVAPALAESEGPEPLSAALSATAETIPTPSQQRKDLIIIADATRSSAGAAEMVAAKTLTTKVLAIGSWTAKATPETRPAIMPSEARDTLRLQLAGKIDQWFAKSDGSGAVFLMNVTDPAEAHKLPRRSPVGTRRHDDIRTHSGGPLVAPGAFVAGAPEIVAAKACLGTQGPVTRKRNTAASGEGAQPCLRTNPPCLGNLGFDRRHQARVISDACRSS